VDGRGRIYVPGTSLAGAIRAFVDRAHVMGGKGAQSEAANAEADAAKRSAAAKFEQDHAPGQGPSRQIWGHGLRPEDVQRIESKAKANGKVRRLTDQEKAEKKEAEGVASRVVVRDAYLKNEVSAEIRDHVGIDRGLGTAAAGIKYDRQILPKGARLDFHMEVELAGADIAGDDAKFYPRNETGDRAWVAVAVDGLCKGRIRFGGAKTRGLGKLCLRGAQVAEHRTNERNGVLELVKLQAGRAAADTVVGTGQKASAVPPPMMDAAVKACVEKIAGSFQPPSPPILRVRICWRPDGPVMVKSSTEGLGVDMLPLVSGTETGRLAMVIPGSSIKGRLRAHAEMIAATVLDRELPPEDNSKGARDLFIRRIERVPLVKTLFGIAGPRQGKEKARDGGDGLGLGAVFVDDCFAENRNATPEDWQALVSTPKDGNQGMELVRAALEKMGWAAKGDPGGSDDPATHVAIDRWTGGAAEAFLYSSLEPRGVEWSPIVVEVALDQLKPAPGDPGAALAPDAAIALLFLTLKDFALGRVPLGFGGNRGYGAVKIVGLKFEVEGAASSAVAALAGWVPLAPEATRSNDSAPLAELDDEQRLKPLNEAWKKYLDSALSAKRELQ
jgi:CRISPR/Cas system CSM-associated protein Csm3 (group 7 of RAMP superfamily)